MRSRAYRRHQAERNMRRRLKEDRNQHYNDLDCPCWTDPKAMARFKEQPKFDCHCCVCAMEKDHRLRVPKHSERRQEWIE